MKNLKKAILIVLLSLLTGVLLINKNQWSLFLATTCLIMFLNIGLSIIVSEVMSGLTFLNEGIKVGGVSLFSVLMIFDVLILTKIFRKINIKFKRLSLNINSL